MIEQPQGASERSARAAVIRSAIFFTPLLIAGIILTLLSTAGVIDAGPVLTAIEVLVTLLFAYQSIQALRDLRASLRRTEGPIGRRWSKMDLLVSHSYYISVGRTIFRIPIQDWYDLKEGDRVLVTHYPHTGTVAGVERRPEGG